MKHIQQFKEFLSESENNNDTFKELIQWCKENSIEFECTKRDHDIIDEYHNKIPAGKCFDMNI